MRTWAVSVCSLLLAACATAPAPRSPDDLFHDRLFAASAEPADAADIFALSEGMRHYLDTRIASQLRFNGTRQALVDAVAKRGELKLEYDSMTTRNAAQTFAARSGNCLSLVIMTGAFAKALDVPVRYQVVRTDETVSRSGGIQFFIGHVNLTLGERLADIGPGRTRNDLMTIDFLPPQEVRGLSTHTVGESTIVAMYMNNRAAEAFARGELDAAYWLARAAIRNDPQFLSAYNTLGVVYHRHGHPAQAERALAYTLERDPRNTRAMSNLVRVLNDLGRHAEAREVAAKLAQLEPNPPFAWFERGMRALDAGNPLAARDLFAKEVDRMPHYHEFRYWLGVAYLRLGDLDRARKQMQLASEYATTRNDHDLYAAKLGRLGSSRLQ